MILSVLAGSKGGCDLYSLLYYMSSIIGHMSSMVYVTLQLGIIQLEGGNALVQKVSPAVYNSDIIIVLITIIETLR